MAEFKLGRIRFVWKDVWTTGTTYYVDDVVRNGGKTYICQVGHSASADFYTDLDYSPTKWDQLTDGQEWTGDWSTATFYKENDIVKYGSTVYICNQSHTSAATSVLGLEADQSKWDTFAESIEWKSVWAVDTQYKLNDLVKYGGYTYVCNTPHISAATLALGLEADQANWDSFNEGLEYKGSWSGSSVVYKVNDIVKQGAGLWICTQLHTSTISFTVDAGTYWNQFVEGLEFENSWSNVTTYQPGDVVVYGGNQYIAKTNHINEVPSTSTANWDLFQEGISFSADWSNVTNYRVGNLVRLRGYTYLATADSLNQEPPNLTYWEKLNSGISWQNEWIDDVEYKLGDAVRFGSNAYICILGHRAEGDDGSTAVPGSGAASSRPDQDITGTYWNLLSIGTETSILIARGDLVYYGGAGPARLPVGLEGQVLVAGTEDPEWRSLGATDQVYYVAPHGTDLPSPIHGKSLDLPFKTIRYACEQVENGPRNANAQYLLELNRLFIQREIGAWIDYQITNATVGSIWEAFNYDNTRCERDVGFIVDRLSWDIGHGGNLKIRAAAQSLLGILSEGPLSTAAEDAPYATLVAEKEQGIAAYNYLLQVIGAVLSNEAPAVVYQNVINDSVAIVAQYINTNVIAEAGVVTAITALVTIVINALANPAQTGDLPTIPARYVPSTVIKVATGRYREILPIIVPAYTCILGDELRSTNAGPASSVVDIVDSYYTIKTYDHVKSIIGKVVAGTTVTPISGNALTQSQQWPFADTDEVSAVTTLVEVMKQQADYLLGTLHVAKLTNPVGYNVSYLTGYGNARKLLAENKKFLQEEAISYIDTTYSKLEIVGSISGNILTVTSVVLGIVTANTIIRGSGVTVNTNIDGQLSGTTGGVGTYEVNISQTTPLTTIKADTQYSRTKFRRDVGDVIQAVIYDITYGGNAQSIMAGLAYFDSDSPMAVAQLPASQKAASIGAMEFLKTRMQQVANESVFTVLQTATPRYRDTAGSAGASTLIGDNVDDIIQIITTGPSAIGVTVTLTDPTITDAVNSTTALISAYSTLNSAAATIILNTIAFVDAAYPALVYDSDKFSRDIGIILKAVGYDFMLGNTASITEFSNYQTLKVAHAYLGLNATAGYTLGQKTATIAAIEYAATQAVANVGGNATAIARINVLMTLIGNIIYGATNEGTVCSTELRNRDHAILQLERNREFIIADVSAYIAYTYTGIATNTTSTSNVITIASTSWLRRGTSVKFSGTPFGNIVADTIYYVQSIINATTFKVALTKNGGPIALVTATGLMTLSIDYSSASCARDVGTYINALKWDLRYTSNYKSRYVSRYYANAVLGSLEEDMFYLRDGTGIRDSTLEGLHGDLTSPNLYSTSRVSAGAYASLDPGWGPDDFRTWIMTRSPYVQGVTTLGTGAIGQKIDGALHNGGNKSIVSNDFTQVISDGIGAWVANNGRAELVSVFSYYAHIGYLATQGGRIRGTNGNNSYGDFGSVAEGFDDTEAPNTGVVDNIFQFVATVDRATTTGQTFIGLEFDNAGVDYTEAAFTLTGGGIGATAEADEFRDDAVYQVRLLQLAEDGLSGEFGGSGYVTNANTAQGGSSTEIIIAATDSETSTAYIGMKIVITGGTGVGQFAIVNTYNSGTKVAQVNKESTGVAGWDHLVAGTLIAAPDASSTYAIEPRITFTAPAYTQTLLYGGLTEAPYTDVKYVSAVQTYLAVASTGGTGALATFNVIKKGTKYISSVGSGGTGYARLDVLTIAGTSLGGESITNKITITVTSINTATGAITAFDQVGTGQGGNFVSLTAGTIFRTRANSGWTNRTAPASLNWVALASGPNLTPVPASGLVTGTAYKITVLGDSFFNAVGAETNLVGQSFIATGPTSGSGLVVEIVSAAVAIATGSAATARSIDGGVTWVAGGNLPVSTTWSSITYGQGSWVAVAAGGTANAYSTNGGQTWVSGAALPASTNWSSITYGGGKFVAVASGGTQAARSSDNGLTWSAQTLPSSTAWSSVTFGNNRFVAVSSTSGTTAAYSLDGISWVASTIISAAYTSIAYGQGVFLAAGVSITGATSPDGIVWTSRTLQISNNIRVAAGNVNRVGEFTIISSNSANCGLIKTGATARARASVANGKIFIIRMLEPGSGYTVVPTMTITDPNNIFEAPFTVRTGKGVLGNPSFINRGSQYETANAEISSGDGNANNYQTGSFIACRRFATRPVPGSNIVFSNLPDRTFKLVNIVTSLGELDGSYTGFLQVSPQVSITDSPEHLDDVTLRLRYSQVRLTGHDFLSIGSGSFTETNYPNTLLQAPIPANETVDNNGGRVFFTSTDQDGNFRVGDLFSIEQSTGIATLNADAFNISGLQELNLGNVTLGGGSATVTEFSTDPFFTADSDNIVPTQRAIKAFISGQIGGGGASLNVNSVTAGSIVISSNVITTVTGIPITIDATFDFRRGVTGYPLAFNFFLN
jgi:hypothetical protein